MSETQRAYAELSPEQQAVVRNKVFAGEFGAEPLIEQMRVLAKFDVTGDTHRGKVKGRAILFGVLTFLSFIASFFVGPLALIAFALLLAATIWLAVRARRLGTFDLSNNFRDTALPFVTLLKQDMTPEQTLTVRIDLAPPTDKRKLVGKSKPYKKGNYLKIVDTTYRDAWFEGTARLADGSVLGWEVVEDVVDSSRQKRGSRGKIKIKSRQFKRSVVTVTLAVPHKTYGVSAQPWKPGEKLSVRDGEKRQTIKFARKIKSRTHDPLDPRALVDAVAEAYKRVTPPTRTAA